jgi:hypothetical protein
MIKRTFNPGFRIKLHQKDLNLALQGARALGVSAAADGRRGAADAGLRRARRRRPRPLGAGDEALDPGQFAHAQELAPVLVGEDPNDIARLWDKLCWAGASVGRSGLATQAIGAFDVALWDLKARRAGLSLAKLLGAHRDTVACYNTSGGFLHTPIDQLLVNAAASRERGIGGIKLKVGQPDRALDIQRVKAVRQHLGDAAPLMVDANQQWDRPTAQRMCRVFEDFNLVWIEHPHARARQRRRSSPTTAACPPAPCCPGRRLALLVLRDRVPQGHKVALVDIAAGAPVRRYGVPIGHALKDIPAGSWVHERCCRCPPRAA